MQSSRGRIVAAYREVATGRRDTLKNRPELGKALAHARRSGALFVIARWDRLSRNVSVTAQLLESGVDFVACDNP
jgi:DNA invertase Pin-like site-specific DNA recombinase